MDWYRSLTDKEQIEVYFASVILITPLVYLLASLIVQRLKKVALMKKKEGKGFVFEVYSGLLMASLFPLFFPCLLFEISPLNIYLPSLENEFVEEFLTGLILFWHIILWIIIFIRQKGKEISQLYKVAQRDMHKKP